MIEFSEKDEKRRKFALERRISRKLNRIPRNKVILSDVIYKRSREKERLREEISDYC